MRLFRPALWAAVLLGFVVGTPGKGRAMNHRDLGDATPALRPATLWKTPF
jgi:hypothetical protein